jgi:hypothetical protein
MSSSYTGGNFNRAREQGQIQQAILTTPMETRVRVGSKIIDGRKKDVVAYAYQSAVAGINRAYYTIPLSPAPANTLFTGSNTYQFTLLPGTITDQVKSMRLNLQFQNTGGTSVTMTPPNMGLQRLEIYSGQNELLNTIYAEDIMIRWALYFNNFEFNQFSYNVGLTTSWSPNVGELQIAAGNYLNLSLPVITMFDSSKLHMEKVIDSLQFKFYSRNSVATGSGTLALVGSPSLTFDVLLDSDIYRREVDMLYDNNCVKAGFLDCFNISQSMTVTAGQTVKISLQNIIYKVPFFVFCLRSSVSATNNGYSNFQSLGSITDSTQFNIQLQDPSGYDILNRGSGLSPSDMQLINAMYNTDNTLFANQNMYFVPLTTSVKRSCIGDQSAGFWYFDGSLYNLAILPGNNFPSATYTVDIYVYYFRSLECCYGHLKANNY